MDPITQTLLGAAAAQTFFNRKLGRWAAIIGGAAGELPDIDILFTRFADPATADFQYHRHLTHSLLFVPFGAGIATLPFMIFPSLRRKWKPVYGAAFAGIATHALLDTCTSWGTMLLWPFTDMRYGWDVISIIDPVYTLILFLGVLAAFIWKSRKIALIALALSMVYMGLGVVQHARGMCAQRTLAAQRGHDYVRGRVMPTFANLIIWRSVYEANGALHADGLRVPFLGEPQILAGESIAALDVNEIINDPQATPRVQAALRRFDNFADGYTAWVPDHPDVIGDMRYGRGLGQFTPLWGVGVRREADALVPFAWSRWTEGNTDADDLGGGRRDRLEQVWRMMYGEGDWKPFGD